MMIPVKPIDPDDLPLYAMQLLSPEETKELTEQLAHSSEGRRLLSEIFGELAALAYTSDMQDPPALARARLMKHVGREKKVVPIDRSTTREVASAPVEVPVRETHRSGPIARVLPWLGWAIAAGIAIESSALYQQTRRLQNSIAVQQAQLAQTMTADQFSNLVMETLKNPSAQNVVLTPNEGKIPPQGRATYDPRKGSLIFIASNLEPLQPYKTYELWLLPADGHAPIPAGIFHPDAHGNASVILPQLPAGTAAKGFGVTVENGLGSPTPTSAIILKGNAA